MNFKSLFRIIVASIAFLFARNIDAEQPFVHPGGLHTLSDLERMRTNVLAGNHPWIDAWQQLLRDPQSQSNWKPAAQANLGVSRQRADLDAHAAYLNALRWYISSETNHAECAVRICHAWSSSVNQIPRGTDIPGLSGIPIFDFALAGELLRVYPGWKAGDFNAFTNMMVAYFYPQCHGFLSNHDGRCISYFWANWDACNIGALIAMGVLCDNTNIFNEGVDYFKRGDGMGSISNAVPFLYPNGLGQWQESGRDQEHAQLGVGLLGSACQVAWNQGVDLFGYADNRLLAGAEYVAKCNLSYPIPSIPYTFYDNCANARQFYLSRHELGRLDDRPVWELIYNHYSVLRGLPAPYSKAAAQLVRPECGSKDHFGYGTLTFTLDPKSSPYPPCPIPQIPTGLKAEAGVGRVSLNWEKAANDDAQGYIIRRAKNPQGPFMTVASWKDRTSAQFTDNSVSNGVTYYYVVAATNQAGASADSPPVAAQPEAAGSLPREWANRELGKGELTGNAKFARVGENTFVASGAGGNIGGRSDALSFTSRMVTGDFVFTARLFRVNWSGSDKVGLMSRESLAPEAKAVALTVGDVGNRQCRFGTRTVAETSMTWQAGNDYTVPPVWFRVERKGGLFTAYQSADCIEWFKVGASTLSMTNQCFVGLAIATSKKETFNTTVFDHVTLQQ